MPSRAAALNALSFVEDSQTDFKVRQEKIESDDNDALDALSFPSSPSGGSGIQENGSMLGGMSFDYFAFSSSKISALKQVFKGDLESNRGISPLRPRLSKLSLPSKTPEIPFQKSFKRPDFLNKLQKIAFTNWLKAEVISPFVAGVLLLITYLRGEVLLPSATALLYRRRQRGLSF